MWIASKFGFFSLVNKDGGWHVRARDKNDLVGLQRAVGGEFQKLKVHVTPDADYIARVFVPAEPMGKALISAVMLALGDSLDYPNFKSMIQATPEQRDKLPYYHAVWHEMAAYQTGRIAIAYDPKKGKRGSEL